MGEIQMSPLWDNIIRLRVLLGRYHMLGLWVGEECCLHANFRPVGMELRTVLNDAVELGLAQKKALSTTTVWNFHTKGEPMRESDIELVDKLTRAFGVGEPIDAKLAHKRTALGSVQDWADRLYVLAESGLLRLRSRGSLGNGQDAEYSLGKGVDVGQDDRHAGQTQRMLATSDLIALILRQMIAAFGGRLFTLKEAIEITGQKQSIVIGAIYSARRNWWMSPGVNRFYLDKIPSEWKGKTTETATVESELTREQKLYLIWRMGSPERVGWDYILVCPLGFDSRTELYHFMAREVESGEFVTQKRFGRTTYYYWVKTPSQFPHLDHLLDD